MSVPLAESPGYATRPVLVLDITGDTVRCLPFTRCGPRRRVIRLPEDNPALAWPSGLQARLVVVPMVDVRGVAGMVSPANLSVARLVAASLVAAAPGAAPASSTEPTASEPALAGQPEARRPALRVVRAS